MKASTLALSLTVILSTACPAKSAPPPGAVTAVALGQTQSAAGIRFSPPSTWVLEGPRPMRVATYRIPAASGDKEDGECGIFYFGSGQGGSVDQNLGRWLGQFQQTNGQPLAAFDRRDKQDVGGVGVTTVDVSGTFQFSATPMSPDKTPKPGYRMLGAIIEAPQGNVFVKVTGPASTIGANSAGFDAMLRSITRS